MIRRRHHLKFISGLLAVMMVVSMLIFSCSNTADGDSNSTTTSGNNETVTTTYDPFDRESIKDDVEDEDFGNYDFRILYRNGCNRGNWASYEVHRIEIWAEESSADVIDEAVWKRNNVIEDRFNINIIGIAYPKDGTTSETGVVNYARTSIQSGMDEFDIIVADSLNMANLAAEGLLVNWNDIDNIDMSKPWWRDDAMETYTVYGKTFIAMNDIIFPGIIGEAAFYMFNKKLVSDFALEDPYTVVNEGRWTIDYLNEVVKNCFVNVNGNTVRDTKNIYGLASDAYGTSYAMMWAGGERVTSIGEDGLPYYDLYTERNFNLLQKIYKLFYENEGSAISAQPSTITFASDYQAGLFSLGNAVFLSDRVGVMCTPSFRNASFDYGVLPMPKYDEEQAEYLTMINEHASAMGVPLTAKDLNIVGKVVESLSAESYKTLVPAYYETALKVKFSRDEETVKMLDLISNGIVYDFALLYNVPTFDIFQTFLLTQRDPAGFTAYIEANQDSAIKKIQDILDLYAAIE